MMTASKFFAVAALATVASFGAQADEADGSQFGIQFNSTRSVAEVRAEAAAKVATHSQEPAGSRVAATVQSSTDRATVRAQAADAVRLGQIPRGEASYM
ncbi:MAG: DUF4148 domain-containing protein [Polaromonas sp.]|uniref:DUF4148 domain-containing protein n=1 Tax=Polaromonas sp. TaxID=1869339 RepID=UPI00248A35CA|nr:DUF4148 domain-containing protein [Polaromonas sp.]MDI1269361.1 DUF4148 domain-containing protein [Polaromonas sp.]